MLEKMRRLMVTHLFNGLRPKDQTMRTRAGVLWKTKEFCAENVLREKRKNDK